MRYYDAQLPVDGDIKGQGHSQHIEDLFQKLQNCGFSCHPLIIKLTEDDTPDDELIEAYREQIEQLMDDDAYAHLEVIRLQNYSRETDAYVYKPVRDKFEARIITHGKCSLFVQVDGQIFEFHCSQGDVVRIPAELCYWFEVGVHACRYIHLYMTEEAWDKPSERQDIQPCHTVRQTG